MTIDLTVTSITVQPEISAAQIVITPTFSSNGGQSAPIISISKNGVNIAPDVLKNVDIEVPTATSELTNDSVFITEADLAPYATNEALQSVSDAVTAIEEELPNLQPKTDNTLETVEKNVVGAINELKARVDELPEALTFDTVSLLVSGFNSFSATQYRKGQNALIVALNVPDTWITATHETSIPYVYVDDETFIADLIDGIRIGYYTIHPLETEKVNLENYYTKAQIDQLFENYYTKTESDNRYSPLRHDHSGEGISPDYVVLDAEYTDTTMLALPVGSLFYNVDQLAWLLKTTANTYLNLGEENTYIAKNGDGVTHLEGQVTYVTSGGGNLDVMTLASSANGKIDALLTQDVSHTGNGRGMYCFGGKVRTFPYSNVIKSTDNENTWVEGAELYLCSEAGRYSTTKEAAPAKCSIVGKITQRNGANISVSFRPFKALSVTDLSDVDGAATTVASGDSFFIKVGNLWKTITESNFLSWFRGLSHTWTLIQDFASGLKTNSITKRNGSGLYKLQDGGTEWHITKWFTPTGTFSSVGTAVTTTGGQLTSAMVGAKIGVGEDKRVITAFLTSNTCTVDSAFSQDYSGIVSGSWGVYNVKFNNDFYPKIFTPNGVNGASLGEVIDGVNSNFYINKNTWELSSALRLLFSSTTNYSGTKDTGLRRANPGLLEINDGITNGNVRDLKLRSLYGDKIIPNSDTTGLVIRNAADSADVVKVDTSGKIITMPIKQVLIDATTGKSIDTVYQDTSYYYATTEVKLPTTNNGSQIRFSSKGATNSNGRTYFAISPNETGASGQSVVFGVGAGRAVVYGSSNSDIGILHLGGKAWEEDGLIILSGRQGNNTGLIQFLANKHTRIGQFDFNAASATADTIKDIRTSNQSGVFKVEICTVANATKGSGTWVEIFRIDANGFQSAQYDDILPSAEWTPASGGTAPDTATHTIGGMAANYKAFDGNATEESMVSSFEILHGIDVDSLNRATTPLLMEIHTHGMPATTGSGDVKIFYDLVYQPVNAAPIAWGTYSNIITISANQQYYHKLGGVELTKPSSGYNIGDQIIVKYRRTPSDAQDTYAGDWLFMQCALHAPMNSNGSRQRYVK